MDEITAWVDGLLDRTPAPDIDKDTPLEDVPNGQAIELWMAPGGKFLLVDQQDAALVMKRYGAGCRAEARRIVRVTNPVDLFHIHKWKRQFNAIVDDVEGIA
jgi:hypothetical protein